MLHLFTGTHDAYHSPADGRRRSTRRGRPGWSRSRPGWRTAIARRDVTPHYARATSAPAREGDSRGYGAYLGTVPDYRAMGGGRRAACSSPTRGRGDRPTARG